MSLQVLGWTDFPKCDRCGRDDLERTVAVEEEGNIAYYGSECIKKVLGRQRGGEALGRADIIAKLQRVCQKRGWTATEEWALRYYGWGTRNGNIVDGLGRIVLKSSS